MSKKVIWIIVASIVVVGGLFLLSNGPDDGTGARIEIQSGSAAQNPFGKFKKAVNVVKEIVKKKKKNPKRHGGGDSGGGVSTGNCTWTIRCSNGATITQTHRSSSGLNINRCNKECSDAYGSSTGCDLEALRPIAISCPGGDDPVDGGGEQN